jgi:hypothetical protein
MCIHIIAVELHDVFSLCVLTLDCCAVLKAADLGGVRTTVLGTHPHACHWHICCWCYVLRIIIVR